MIYNFPQNRGACLSSTVPKKSMYWFVFSTDENYETLESSVMNDGRLMFLTVLYRVEGIETETLKQDLMQ